MLTTRASPTNVDGNGHAHSLSNHGSYYTCSASTQAKKAAAKRAAKYKFGVQIPKHPMHTLELDCLKGNMK